MHNRIFSRSIILNTPEHRSTIKALAGWHAATRAAGHQPTNSWRPATVMSNAAAQFALCVRFARLHQTLSLLSCSFLPLQHPALAASSLSNVGGELPSLAALGLAGSWVMDDVKNAGIMRKSTSKQHASAAYQSWHTLWLYPEGRRVSETLPTSCLRRPRFPARKTQLKSSTLTRSSQVVGLQ